MHASINGKEILKGINLTVNPGEIHALMGQNGAGKSTTISIMCGQLKADSGSDRFQAYIFMKMILDIIHCFDAVDGIYMAAPQVAHTGGVIYDTLTVQAAKTGLCVRLIKLPYIIIAESIAFYLFHAFFDTET